MIAVLIKETRVSDISDISTTIHKIFINRYLDDNMIYKLNDTNKMHDAKTILEQFINSSMIDLLYTVGEFDLMKILPDFIKTREITNRLNNTYYFMYDNFFMGSAVYAINNTPDGNAMNLLNEIYNHLQLDNSQDKDPNKYKDYSNKDPEMNEILFGNDQAFHRFDNEKIGVLLPGNISNDQAHYLITKYGVFLLIKQTFLFSKLNFF